jgi:hypothetical protein
MAAAVGGRGGAGTCGGGGDGGGGDGGRETGVAAAFALAMERGKVFSLAARGRGADATCAVGGEAVDEKLDAALVERVTAIV